MDELQRYGLLSIACLIVLCLALTFKDRDHANAKTAKTPIVKPDGVGEGETNDASAMGAGDAKTPPKGGGEIANQEAGPKSNAGNEGKAAPSAKDSPTGKESSVAANTNGADGKDKTPPVADPDLQPSTYKVQAGDTFRKIAKAKLGDEARFAEIVAANPGVKANSLKAGSTLKIPPKSKAPAQSETKSVDSLAKDSKDSKDSKASNPEVANAKNASAPADVKSPPSAKTKSKKDLAESAASKSDPKKAAKARTVPASHKVGRGESLASIARKYYDDATDWKKIYSANKSKMKNSSDIHEGLVLTLP